MERKPSADWDDAQQRLDELGVSAPRPAAGPSSMQFWLLVAIWTAAGAWLCLVLHLSNSGSIPAEKLVDFVLPPLAAVVLLSLMGWLLLRFSKPPRPPADGSGPGRSPIGQKEHNSDSFTAIMRPRMEDALQELAGLVGQPGAQHNLDAERVQRIFKQLQCEAMALAWMKCWRPELSPLSIRAAHPLPGNPGSAAAQDAVVVVARIWPWLVAWKNWLLQDLTPWELTFGSPSEAQRRWFLTKAIESLFTRFQLWLDGCADTIKDLMLDWAVTADAAEPGNGIDPAQESIPPGSRRRSGKPGFGWADKYRRMARA